MGHDLTRRGKMKKTSLICCISLLLFAAAAFAACEKQPEQAEFAGFTIAETATAEAGTEYVFETPSVTCEGKAADVSVSVKFGEDLIANDGKKVYLEQEGAYVITYTASSEGNRQSKSTALTVRDATGPIILSRLPQGIKYNTTVLLGEYFSAKDISGGSITGFSVKDVTSGTESDLPENHFNAEENSFRITDESVKTIRVTANAKDTKNQTSSRTVDVKMMPITEYGAYDFQNCQTGSTEVDGLTVDFGNNAENTAVSVVEDGGRKALKIEATTTAINNVISVRFDANVIGEFGSFSAIDAELKFVKNDLDGKPAANGGNAGLGGEFNYAEGDTGNAFTYSNGEWKTFTFSRENSFTAIKANGAVQFFVKPWAEQRVEIYIAGFQGRYASLLADGNEIDLTEELGLSENEFSAAFTPADGAAAEVENVRAFLPESSGTLKVSVVKDGYKPTETEISVAGAPVYGRYVFDDMSLYSSAVAGGVAMESSEVGGYTVLSGSCTGTYPHFVITAPCLKSLADFDYFTVRYKLTYSSGGGVIGLQGTSGNVYNYPEHGDGAAPTDGEWKVSTWRKDRVSSANVPTGQYVWDYIAANGVLDFSLYAFNGTSVQTTFVIAEITGGFDDAESDGATPIDLTAKYGSGLTQAVYTPAGGEAQTLAGENLKTFVGAQAGTLRLTFEKEGFRKSEIAVQYKVIQETFAQAK